jgi:methyl-accepting chemotaxis protein
MSIHRRLTRAVVLTTAGSLLVTCLLFLLYDARAGRTALIERSEMLARVVAINSAVPLTFADEAAARETLEGLAGAESVLAAVIYAPDGALFASFRGERGGDLEVPSVRSEQARIAAGRLHLFHPIHFQGEEVGTLYLALDASALRTRLAWYALIVAVVMAGAAVWSGWASARLRRQIARPLGELAEGARAISAGDLSAQVEIDREDEIGELARSFNHMSRSLRAVVAEVRASSGSVAEVSHILEERGTVLSGATQRQNAAITDASRSVEQVSRSILEIESSAASLAGSSRETSSSIVEMDALTGEIASSMDQLSEAIETTSAAGQQVASNVEQVLSNVGSLESSTGETLGRLQELSRSVREVEANAAQSLSFSEASSRDAAEGRTAAQETTIAMREIQTAFANLEDRVDRLAKKSQSIDEIVQVITEVAEQTGLLSLNASIIAAQAGEHGRAFSVVADQVSSLADRSHRSASEIAELIRAVQEDTQAAVGAVEEGSAKVERGVRRSNLASEVLHKIIDGTQASTERVREIAAASSRQSEDLARVDRSAHEVREHVGMIKQSTAFQHDATRQIGSAMENLRELGTLVRESTTQQRRGSRLIMEAATRVTAKVDEIAEVLRDQAEGRATMEAALQIFRDVTEETTKGVAAINASVSTLSDRAKQLEDTVDRFKTR